MKKLKLMVTPRIAMVSALMSAAIAIHGLLLPIPALATKLPAEVRQQAALVWDRGSIRIDGSIALPDGSVVLPLVPTTSAKKGGAGDPVLKVPEKVEPPNLVFYSNGWGHIRCTKKGEVLTIILPPNLPETVTKKLHSVQFPADLIVPEGIVLPKSLKHLVGDLSITLMDDATIARPEFGQPRSAGGMTKAYTGTGTYAVSSVKRGSITLLDGKSFSKIAEFPTEGTPCGMDFIGGKLYITDQAKNRVLLLDPVSRKFLGQIDLAPQSTPRGIAGLPDGKWIYVSESGPSNIAVIETNTGKLLLKTKVPTGPGKVAVTPDGIYLLVLNVTSGELSVLSTYNQKLVGSIKTGSVPSGIAVNGADKIAYVSNRNSDSVSVVDIQKRIILHTIKTNAGPTGLTLSKDGGKLFVACGRDNSILVFETKTFTKLKEQKLPLDIDFPGAICLTPDGRQLLVTSQQTDTIGLYDAETLELKQQLRIGHPTHDILWLPAG
ncbi:MAG: beta-propeller fold lactonase family protein [Candidatus Obscuribacterales bacterium]|nr:beta-propeller fold lactonase family protein [Candidatus Obscuribacterales bacterium]